MSVRLSGNAGIVVSARTFTGVDPGPLTAVTANGKSSTISVGVPASPSHLVVDWAVHFGDAATAVAAADQTEDVNRATTSTGFDLRGLASQKNGTTSNSAMSWKLSLSKAWATIAVPLAPAG